MLLPPPCDGAEKDLPAPRPDGATVPPDPPLPRNPALIPGSVLMPGAAWGRGALKMERWLLGIPVEMKPLRFLTPMPAKVLPLKRATGSTRKTRCPLRSLKWLDTKETLLCPWNDRWKSCRMK